MLKKFHYFPISKLLIIYFNFNKIVFFNKLKNLFFFFRKSLNEQKEMKLLLDMYKGVSKEQRDKVQLMAAEKKTKAEVDDLKQQVKKMQMTQVNVCFVFYLFIYFLKLKQRRNLSYCYCFFFFQENKREERKKLCDEDAMRKIKQLEDQGYLLQKQVASQKQVKNINS